MLLYCPCLCICIHFGWKRNCAVFSVYLYLYWRSSQEGRVRIPLTSLTPPHFSVCVMPGFPTSCVVICFRSCLSELRWNMGVRFVDIGGIVYHPCLKFLFINSSDFHNHNLFPCIFYYATVRPWPLPLATTTCLHAFSIMLQCDLDLSPR